MSKKKKGAACAAEVRMASIRKPRNSYDWRLLETRHRVAFATGEALVSLADDDEQDMAQRLRDHAWDEQAAIEKILLETPAEDTRALKFKLAAFREAGRHVNSEEYGALVDDVVRWIEILERGIHGRVEIIERVVGDRISPTR